MSARRMRAVERRLKEYNYRKSTHSDLGLCCSSCSFSDTRFFEKPDKIQCMKARGYVKTDGICDRFVSGSKFLTT